MNLFEGRLATKADTHNPPLSMELNTFYGVKLMDPMNTVKMDTHINTMESSPIVIYHSPCQDGFTAAWCFYRYGKENGINYEFIPGVYQEPPPDVTGRHVFLVDFSYKREVVEKMLETAESITLIDHHKSALEDLLSLEHERFFKYTDMARSGAGLAWDYLFPNKSRPGLLNIVEDRDLWRFKFSTTREHCAGLFAMEYNFSIWDRYFLEGWGDELYAMGEGINRKFEKDLKEFLPLTKRHIVVGTIPMLCANVPYMWASEAGNVLAKEAQYGAAATYYDSADYRHFSLRSVSVTDPKDAHFEVDVSQIAKQYGGGGHKNAAEFKVPRNHTLATF